MHYFVTGATGFIGRFLVERLAAHKDAKIHVLVRESSRDKFEALVERLGDKGACLEAVSGDITAPGVISAADLKRLKGKIDQLYHLAAVYDMNMDDETADRFNIEGTRNVVQLANDLGGKLCLNHVSSVAVAGGNFVGTFTEKMFEEGQSTIHPYFRTKFMAEKIVREEARVPFRIYRPGTVVGDSTTGEIDKVDGPYYFFKTIQRLSTKVPKWVPLLGVDGGRVPIVPVDYVVDALDAISHKDGLDGQCFHLLQSPGPTVGELMSVLFEAAHGPEFASTLSLPTLPPLMRRASAKLTGVIPESMKHSISKTIGIPVSVLAYITNRAVFDDRNTRAALKGTKIHCPDIHDYADKLWAFWEHFLDNDYHPSKHTMHRLQGQVVLITGASSGIGFVTAKKLAAAGAKVILVARTREKLEDTQHIIQANGGEAYVYPCDLTDLDAIDVMAAAVLKDFGHVDVLVNNAGRSIRRAVAESYDRFHDFQRTMQLNYFGAIRLIMALLPSMVHRKQGQIINISSIGVLANAARFSAYVASKSALDAFTRCLSAEVRAQGIHTTAIYMPLVRTPMIAPTKIYSYIPTKSPDDAADTVIRAILEKPKSIATPLGTMASISYALWPKVNDYVLSKGFQLFPSSSAARGAKEKNKDKAQPKPTLEQVVFANVFKGEHW
ncbi:MAG: SDR family oxidoreductase [Nevskiaceae bacterium]|nr:MAG: SDR family oxidoreductase [Nevskiaceae bacterium]TBR72731.1 MAG: SDR family oxidoreductase [Nevskiaceae bacterium]